MENEDDAEAMMIPTHSHKLILEHVDIRPHPAVHPYEWKQPEPPGTNKRNHTRKHMAVVLSKGRSFVDVQRVLLGNGGCFSESVLDVLWPTWIPDVPLDAKAHDSPSMRWDVDTQSTRCSDPVSETNAEIKSDDCKIVSACATVDGTPSHTQPIKGVQWFNTVLSYAVTMAEINFEWARDSAGKILCAIACSSLRKMKWSINILRYARTFIDNMEEMLLMAMRVDIIIEIAFSVAAVEDTLSTEKLTMALYVACATDNVSAMESLMITRPLKRCRSWKKCAFEIICGCGSVDLLFYLLMNKIAAPGDFMLGKSTPFVAACERGHYNVVKTLLSSTLVTNMIRNACTNGLVAAAMSGCISTLREVLRCLKQTTSPPSLTNCDFAVFEAFESALKLAALHRRVAVVKELISVMPHIPHDTVFSTAFMFACSVGSEEIARMLAFRTMNPEERSFISMSCYDDAYTFAMRFGHRSITQSDLFPSECITTYCTHKAVNELAIACIYGCADGAKLIMDTYYQLFGECSSLAKAALAIAIGGCRFYSINSHGKVTELTAKIGDNVNNGTPAADGWEIMDKPLHWLTSFSIAGYKEPRIVKDKVYKHEPTTKKRKKMTYKRKNGHS